MVAPEVEAAMPWLGQRPVATAIGTTASSLGGERAAPRSMQVVIGRHAGVLCEAATDLAALEGQRTVVANELLLAEALPGRAVHLQRVARLIVGGPLKDIEVLE